VRPPTVVVSVRVATPVRTGAADDVCETFRLGWNGIVASTPLKPCLSLTAKRRRLIRLALHERSFDDWLSAEESMADYGWLFTKLMHCAWLVNGGVVNTCQPALRH